MAASKAQGKKSTRRKLTAILCADVVGYSRLMGADEEATIETLTSYRKVFTSEIKKHSGRVVDAKDDAILAEFASVVDAVSLAVDIQRELAGKNASLPDERRMDFRIGTNLGDVVVKDGVIYGDGVNVAARLEALAEPGGICISRPVHDQVMAKLELKYDYLGEQQVKNIAEPVRAYRVQMEPGAESIPPREAPDPVAAQENAAGKDGRPSIAVLPFTNLSGDPEQEFFGDGITEDLITDLSKISRLSVTARNTVFTYKSKAVNVKDVGKEQEVAYVLEGSVRKAGNRVRITAQLIDIATGNHLWAERYDRTLEDIFEVQDEITAKIVTALDVKLLDGEQARMWRKSTRNAEAYELFLQGRNIWGTGLNREASIQFCRLLEQAIALDRNFSRAYAALAYQYVLQARNGWGQSPEQLLDRGFEMANKAIELDESLADGHSALGLYYMQTRQFERALAEGEMAVLLHPESADVLVHLTRTQLTTGEAESAVASVRKAMRLTPDYPSWYPLVLGAAHIILGEYEQALAPLKDSLAGAPDSYFANIMLTAAYAALNQAGQAEAQVREVLRINSQFTLEGFARNLEYKNPEDQERIMGLLRKAGLPE